MGGLGDGGAAGEAGKELLGGLTGGAGGVGALEVAADDVGEGVVEAFDAALLGQALGKEAAELQAGAFLGAEGALAEGAGEAFGAGPAQEDEGGEQEQGAEPSWPPSTPCSSRRRILRPSTGPA